jgi:glycosyltransferase involved in cell wall biosynthesis
MISVIMPTYNRFEIVEETIQKVLEIKTDIPFELIVVNDGEELPFSISHSKLQIFKNPKKGVSHARNYGASLSKYPILFFIDDDMWITKESLDAIEKLQSQNFFENSCLVMNWEYPPSLYKKMKKEKIGRYLLNVNFHTMEGRIGHPINNSKLLLPFTAIGSGSFVIKKEIFEEIGKYDDSISFQGEDTEFSNRINQNNISIFIYTPITCYHNQQDRMDIEGHIDREYRGFISQHATKKQKMSISAFKRWIYFTILPFRKLLLSIYTSIPNKVSWDIINFRLIGILSSLAYFKALKKTSFTLHQKIICY